MRDDAVPQFGEQRFIGLATTIDSLLAINRLVYGEQQLSLDEFVSVLRHNYAGREDLRQFIGQRLPAYGSDDLEVLALTERVGRAWADAVAEADASACGVVLRPTFHSWLYNIEQGRETAATPDGRLAGEPLSIDCSPSRGRGRAYTESLRSMARLPHDLTCSGGTPFRLSPSHFEGEDGVERLAALIEGYFNEGGLQLHFVFADANTLREAVARPEEHGDLLIRITGFSEYFVRLLPEVQQEIIRRAE
jgi:formate C-acetyltransferase